MKTFQPVQVRKINDAGRGFTSAGIGKDRDAPALEYVYDFPVQSLFQPANSTIADFSYSILPSPRNPKSLIIPSTLKDEQGSGYAVAWAADSECPAMIVFKAGDGQKLTSQAIRLLPGMLLRPHGLTRDGSVATFSGFDIGLPFGWLGGGKGRLVLLKTADSFANYISNGGGAVGREVLIHQVSSKIVAADDVNAKPNWPKTFPWPAATSQLDASGAVVVPVSPQGGPGQLYTRPSRVIFELTCNAAGLAVATTVGVYVHRDGNAVADYFEIDFPTVPAGANATVEVLGDIANKFASDDTFLVFTSGDAAIRALSINCYRYGNVG